jgi:hypothetical protein
MAKEAVGFSSPAMPSSGPTTGCARELADALSPDKLHRAQLDIGSANSPTFAPTPLSAIPPVRRVGPGCHRPLTQPAARWPSNGERP